MFGYLQGIYRDARSAKHKIIAFCNLAMNFLYAGSAIITLVIRFAFPYLQGGSKMTGTICV